MRRAIEIRVAFVPTRLSAMHLRAAYYEGVARAVLDALLTKYADEGVDDIEDIQMLKVRPLTGFGPRTRSWNDSAVRRLT